MKILHLNTYDCGGGAAIAARRLHTALCNEGVDSSMGVLFKSDDDTSIHQVRAPLRRNFYPIFARLENLPLKLYPSRDKSILFSYPFFSCSSIKKLCASVDIVHLHWIVGTFLSLADIAAITKPVVWTLHDTWAFTGGCHILKNCTGYMTGCRDCPQLSTHSQISLARISFLHKRNTYKKMAPCIISPSQYLANKVQESTLLGSFQKAIIPNTINTEHFMPIEQTSARNMLGLDKNSIPTILFGAVSATSDFNKGFDLLARALFFLKKLYPHPVRLLIFGASHIPDLESTYPVHCLGHLHDEVSLRLAYSAADVFVCPSREENLPNTIMESLACGTPVAAFAVGGIPDMIEHEVNGCLAPPHDTEKLAQGIAYLLENADRRKQMGKAARQVAVERYSAPVIAKQYMELYTQILENKKFHRA